ncbi:TPA: hypothetical protein ACJFE8_002428 [Clostridium sporogenes]
MEFKLNSDKYIEDMDINCFKYMHRSGLSLVYVEDAKYIDKIDVNVTFKIPTINNKGTKHVIEHCIASEIYSVKFLKQYARTVQDKTSYEYIIYKNDIDEIKKIIEEVFFPKYKDNKNIFLREGWRVESKNNKYQIKGIVYDEIREAFTSPLYKIMNYIPYTLNGNCIYGNIPGGIIEEILDLKFSDVIIYHDIYYKPTNCCIYVHGFKCINNIMEMIADILNNYTYKYFNKNNKCKSAKTYKNFHITYPALKKLHEEYFMSINYSVSKPKNQFEYNVYNSLSYLISNEYMGDLTKKLEKNKIKGILKSTFKNSLIHPYFTIILSYCTKDAYNKFFHQCNQSLQKIILNLDIGDIANFVEADICKSGSIDGLILGKYIMEAFCANIDVFSYIQDRGDYEIKRNFINRLKDLFLEKPKYTIIDLSMKNNEEVNKSSLINKAIKNGVVNEYNYRDKNNKSKEDTVELCSLHSNLNIGNFSNEPINDYQIKQIDEIKYFLYNTNDSKVNMHIYFNITEFDYDGICCASILSKYLNSYFYSNNDQSVICFCKEFNDLDVRFVIKISSKKDKVISKLRQIFFILKEISNENFDFDSINNLIYKIKGAYKLDLIYKTEQYLSSRISSYFLCKGFYNDPLRGIGNYKFIVNNLENNLTMKIRKFSKQILNKKNMIVSIYSNDNFNILKNIKNVFNEFHLSKGYGDKKIHSIIKNEGFLISSQLNYIAQGYNLEKLGYENNEKYKLLCKIITHNYLVPILRGKCNVYSCALIKDGNSIKFFSIKDPSISPTLEVFRQTDKYIINNIKNIKKQYNEYKKRFIYNYKEVESTSENDKNTLKVIFPNIYITKKQIISDLNDLKEEDVILFSDLIKDIIEKKCYCIIGNEKDIESNHKLFKSIENLI